MGQSCITLSEKSPRRRMQATSERLRPGLVSRDVDGDVTARTAAGNCRLHTAPRESVSDAGTGKEEAGAMHGTSTPLLSVVQVQASELVCQRGPILPGPTTVPERGCRPVRWVSSPLESGAR